jgi:hypothetical protein
MQSQVLTSAFCVSQMFEVYDATVGQAQKIHGNADYQVSDERTKKKNLLFEADQTLLPLHLSFCRTTLKKEASGKEASGSVFFALRTVTIDPRST